MQRQPGNLAAHTQVEEWREELAKIPDRLKSFAEQITGFEEQLQILERKKDGLMQNQINPGADRMAALRARMNVLTLTPRLREFPSLIKQHSDALAGLNPLLSDVISKLGPSDGKIHTYKTAIALIEWNQQKKLKQQKCQQLLDENIRRLSSLGVLNARREVLASTLQDANANIDGTRISLSSQDIAAHEAELLNLDSRINLINDEVNSNQKQIAELKSDLKSLQEKITLNSREIRGFMYGDDVGELRRLLAAEELRIAAPSVERIDLQSQVDFHTQSKLALESEQTILHKTLQDAALPSKRYEQQDDVAVLQQQLESEKQAMHVLIADCEALVKEIHAQNAMIEQTRNEAETLRNREEELNQALVFQHAVDRFSLLLQKMPVKASPETIKFFDAGSKVLAVMQELEAASESRNGAVFDAELNARILNSCSDLLINPHDYNARKNLNDDSRFIQDGKPSGFKKLLGCIGLFLSAAAAVVGGLMLGGLFPVISLPASVTCIAGGVTLFASGVLLLASGRQKGLDKAVSDFSKLSLYPRVSGVEQEFDQHFISGEAVYGR